MPKSVSSIACIVEVNLFTINLFTMFKIYQKTIGTAIAIGTLLTGIYSLPLNAQDTVLGDEIEAGKNKRWSFTSEDESITIKDDIKELRTYSISDDEDSDLELEEEDRRWGNRGDVDDYTFEVEVYDY